MAYIKNPTEKQKKEWIQKARQNEKQAFEMIQKVAEDYKNNPEHVAEFFSFAANFYNYSPNNVALIYSQNPNATFVQSFLDWKKMDASIIKGSKGINVLVPQPITYLVFGDNDYVQLSQATEEQKALYKKGEIKSYQKMHFGIGNVFDISQTTYPKEKYPEIFNMGYSSDKHHLITQALISFSENEIGCPVTYEDVNSIALRGYYVPHRIVLNHLMEDTVQLSTMSHELGHALAHHELRARERSNSQIEFEGDAISIMLQHNFGIELTEQRKSHLATHFKRYYAECLSKMKHDNPESTHEQLENKVDELMRESFSNIFEIYNANIDAIEQYVSEELNIKNIAIEDPALNDLQFSPRRYEIDERGSVQRLWNGKTVDKFNENDIETFMKETEAILKSENKNMSLPETEKLETITAENTDKPSLKNTVVVNAFAGPGAGKTTSAWAIAAELKKQGLVVEYVPEYAKELVWEENFSLLDGSYEHQMKIYSEQKHRIDRLIGKVDVVVTDSPTISSINYLNHDVCTEEQIKDYNEMALREFKEYKTFNYFIQRGTVYEQEGRIQTLEESKAIDENIKTFLAENQIYYGTYKQDKLELIAANIKTHCMKQNKLASKMENCFKKNGIDKSAFESLIQKGKFKMDNEFMCTYTSENVSLNISLNPFVEHSPQVAYYRSNENVDSLLVTQNQMEFLKELAHERSVLLAEDDADIDAAIHLLEKNVFKSMEFGTVSDDIKSHILQKTKITEIRQVHDFKREIPLEIGG